MKKLLHLLLAGLAIAAGPARAQLVPIVDDDGQLVWPTTLIVPSGGGITLGGVFRTNWPTASGAVVTNLADVQDVSFSSLANYDLFYFDSGTSRWRNMATTSAGRSLLQAADAAAQRTALGLGTAATSASTAFEPAGVSASDVTDSTAAGRALLTGADAAAQRTALGLGTAATSASTAFEPAGVSASDVTDSTAAGRSLLTAADAAAQRTALGLGTAATSASSAFQSADSDLSDLASAGSTGTGAFIRDGASPTFPQVNTPLLIASNVVQTTSSASGTNLVWDLSPAEITISITNNLTITGTTNRPSSSAYVVYRTLLITGTTADKTMTIPTNWICLTTNYSRIPSNGVVLVAGRWSSTEGSGVVAIKAQEGK